MLIEQHGVHLKIVRGRRTKHGDYRRYPDGRTQITINATLNPYRFLMTTIHEIAHLVAFKRYGRNIKPHGVEWKLTFRELMLPLLHPAIFPSRLLPLMARHFKNPRASSDTDAHLSIALQSYDKQDDKTYIFELERGSTFQAQNGKLYVLGNQLRKRYRCQELATGTIYLFQPNAPVTLVKTPK